MDPDDRPDAPGEGGARRTILRPDPGAVSTNGHHPGGGHGTGDSAAVARPTQPLGKGPALVVAAIAGVITVGGFLAAVFAGSGGSSSPTRTSTTSGIRSEPARAALAPILRPSLPPAGVLRHLVVPHGATRTSHSCASIGLYDCAVSLTVPAAPPRVLAFYESELKHLGWAKLSLTATHHGLGTELLEQIPSADSYYWEVGVFVDPATSSTAPAGGSTLEVRLLERDDGS